ncbi:Tyrosine recombinase XerA [uncultured archaeon]|nr:Tyrosine recombinase XerA [uncultured archaeon]
MLYMDNDNWLQTVRHDKKIVEWLTNIDASDNTSKSYISYVRVFCECVNKTPTELIEESIKDIKAGLLPAERNEGQYISKFKECLKARGYADKSFYHGLSAVKSFYGNFDITLPKSVSKIKKANPKRENQNFIERDDIKNLIINAPSLREHAIILVMATSGMAIQEIVNLRIGDIAIDEEGIGTITARRQKSDIDFVTFISPEASHALKNYWEERNRDPDTVVKGNADFVFVTGNNRSKGKQLSTITEAGHFQRLGEKLGYESNAQCKGRKGLVKSRSHALRKFFASTLENSGMPKNKVDFMLGHSVNSTDLAYFKNDIAKLKDLYKTYLPYLTFEKTIEVRSLDTQDAKRLEELDKENKKLKKRIQDIEKDLNKRQTADETLNKLFNDPDIQQMLLKKLKELEKK